MGLFVTAKAYWAGYKFKRSTLGQALALHTQDFFYNGTALAHFSQANKDKLIADLYAKVVAIGGSEDPAAACRELLAEYVLHFAGLATLCLKEAEKADQFYAANPYISGTIWHHIERAVENNEEMAQVKWANPDFDAADLVAYANTRSALMLYYANGLNMVRMELGDRDPQKDWFRPFVEAMMVVQEDRQREKLGLEPLCPGEVRSLPYSLFLNFVVNGVPHPFFHWVRQWPDRYLAGEGPLKAIGTDSDLDRYARDAS